MKATDNPARPMIAPPEEDPNATIVSSSPPCFLHELDPVWLGYLGRDEVRSLLEDLVAAAWSGTVVETAWLRAMLRRHLARLGNGPAPGARQPAAQRTDDHPGSGPAADRGDRLACRVRAALPRLHDDSLRRDLQGLLTIMERDLRRHRDRGDPA